MAALSRRSLKKNVEKILVELGLKGCGVEITLVGDAFMKTMNKRYMGKSGTTDVLSFPQINVKPSQIGRKKIFKGVFLGDILVSLDQAKRQAKAQKIALKQEVLFLILHSILHLVGHDHGDVAERLRMQRLEAMVWKKLLRTTHYA